MQVHYISLDPAMRGWMNEGKSYIPPVEHRRGDARGRRRPGGRSRSTRSFAVGDHVIGMFGVQEYALVDGKGVTKVDTALAPLPVYLGALGMPGMTAYFGLLDVGKPQAGQTVVVSGAAGAVGSVVGPDRQDQGLPRGRHRRRRRQVPLSWSTSSASTPRSTTRARTSSRRSREHCPTGIDVYFDNVGGDILDAALARLARGARVVICGAISQYNRHRAASKGPANYMSLLVNRARMTGMVVFDYAARYGEAAARDGRLAGRRASCKSREHIVDGFENFPETLLKLFAGENIGKLVLALKTGS